MHVSVVAAGYPSASGGAPINLAVLIQALQALGHAVDFVKLDFDGSTTPPADMPCDVVAMSPATNPHDVRHGLSNYDRVLTDRLRHHFHHRGSGAAFFYGSEPTAIVDVRSIPGVQAVAALGDPAHLVVAERIRNDVVLFLHRPEVRPRQLAGTALRTGRHLANVVRWRLLMKHLAAFDWGYATAAHHARLYARVNPRIAYHPSPVLDGPPEPVVLRHIEERVKRADFTALYIGHNLGGTSNTAGVRSLLRLLDRAGADRPMRLIVAGGLQWLEDHTLRALQARPEVTITGDVDLHAVGPAIDVVVNTIPHPLGNRTRIAACAAHGIPAISHRAALHGMPTLESDGGTLLYETPDEFLRAMERVTNDASLRKTISLSAYASYRRWYSRENLTRMLDVRLRAH